MNPMQNVSTNLLSQNISEMIPSVEFYIHSSPILIFLFSALFALVVGVFRADPDKPNYPAMGIAVAACLTAILPPLVRPIHTPIAYLGSGFLADSLTQFGMIGVTLGTLVTLLFASFTNMGRNLLRAELVALLLTASAGLMTMISAGEFLTFFVGLELASIPLYILVGFQRDSRQGLEAALKYFLLGAVASALILMGMAFLYLHTGSLAWSSLHSVYLVRTSPYAIMGVILFISGISFKLALAPFHFWAPDIYQGANAILTGYMASMVKFGVVLALLRILSAGMHDEQSYLMWIFWILGALSIIVGSLFGLVQRSVKRILAYSSVANAGYFALAFAVLAYHPGHELAKEALLSYTAIYAILTLGAFGVLAWLEEGVEEDIERKNLDGLGSKNPFAAVALSIFLLGLAGIPPVAGFFGKLWILNSAVSGGLVGLAVILAIFSAVSLFYYLSLITAMWFHPATSETAQGVLDNSVANRMRLTIAVLAVVSIVIGLIGPRWAVKFDTRMARPNTVGYATQGE
jgi:NADH-quinone oxidoreductase subunit N